MKKIHFLALFALSTKVLMAQSSFTLSNSGCTNDTKMLNATPGPGVVMGYTWEAIPSGPVFTSTASPLTNVIFPSPGTYTIGLSSTISNVTSYTSAVIVIYPTLTLSLSQTSGTTCINQNYPVSLSIPVTLLATGATLYAWFPYNSQPNTGSSITRRPAVSTCYTVTGSSAGGCTATAVTCITVVPQFTISVTPSSASICVNNLLGLSINSVQATGRPPFQYEWLDPIEAPPPSLSAFNTAAVTATPQNNCTYTAQVMDAANCISAPRLVNVAVFLCTGFNELADASAHRIFPNPVNSVLRLELAGNNNDPLLIEISNGLGQFVMRSEADSHNQNINLAGLPNGLYFVKVSGNSTDKTFKVIKE